MKNLIFTLILGFTMMSCGEKAPTELPKYGHKKMVDGKEINHTIPDWTFTNQDNQIVTNRDLADVVYVSDFFFRSCPTICPTVAREMKRVYTEFEGNPQVKFVSFTLDPKRDTPDKLKEYAANLGINDKQWMFLHGDKDETYDLCSEYLQIGYDDDEAAGGINHSGKLILTDKAGHIRSFSEGTDADDTPKMIRDIKILLKEYDDKK